MPCHKLTFEMANLFSYNSSNLLALKNPWINMFSNDFLVV